jgi:trigger factor
VTVKEIKKKSLPVLDDELAREVGSYQTLAELKEAAKKDVEAHKREEAEVKMEKLLFDELVKKAKFEVPASMVERRLESLLEDRSNQLMSMGIKEEDVKKQVEQLRNDLRAEAEKQVRLSFILDEIANLENIKTDEADIEKKLQQIAERVRRPLDEVKAFYHEKEERLDSLQAQAINEKVIQWVKDKAVVQEVK